MSISAKSAATKAFKTAIALGFVGAMAVGGTVPAAAFYINGPGFHVFGRPSPSALLRLLPRADRPRGPYTWNGCPPYYTVQDGVCQPLPTGS